MGIQRAHHDVGPWLGIPVRFRIPQMFALFRIQDLCSNDRIHLLTHRAVLYHCQALDQSNPVKAQSLSWYFGGLGNKLCFDE